MKIRTLSELEDAIAKDMAWRVKEFIDLKLLVSSAKKHKKNILIRASIILSYSHWEGHIKECALIYLCYINHLGISYENLNDNFIQLSLAEKFKEGFSIKKFTSQKQIHHYLTTPINENFKINAEIVINTESNLKFEVFSNILDQLGLDKFHFELKENFINSKLLRCRNAIAHGERISNEEIEETYNEVENELLNLIRIYQNLILNAATTKQYLKTG